MNRFTCILLALLASLLMAGCASVSMVASWKDPSAATGSYGNFLVAGITENRQMRQVFEEVLTAELRKKGLAATPSYTITGVEAKQTRESLEKAVQETGVDAVLTTRIVNRKQEKSAHVGYVMTDRGYTNPSFSRDQVMPVDLFGYYGTSVVSYATFDMQSVEVTTSTSITLEANLFDVATKRLRWSGTVTAVKPVGVITASEEFAGAVITAMSKEGLIP